MIGGANEKQSCFNPYASFDLLYFAKENSNNDSIATLVVKLAPKIISIMIILAYFVSTTIIVDFLIVSFLLFDNIIHNVTYIVWGSYMAVNRILTTMHMQKYLIKAFYRYAGCFCWEQPKLPICKSLRPIMM